MRKPKLFKDDALWGWLAVAVAMIILLMSWLTSCSSKKEAVMEYQVQAESNLSAMATEIRQTKDETKKIERIDTLKNSEITTGEISIERDTAGRPVRIVYLHSSDGVQTKWKTKTDTLREKEYILERDTVYLQKTDTAIEGKTKKKTDAHFGVLGFGGFWLLVCLGVVLLFVMIKKYIAKHSEIWKK